VSTTKGEPSMKRASTKKRTSPKPVVRRSGEREPKTVCLSNPDHKENKELKLFIFILSLVCIAFTIAKIIIEN
jgi:hypothetical protein